MKNAFLAKAPGLYHFPPPEGDLHRKDKELPLRRHVLLTLSSVSFKRTRAEEDRQT